MERFLFVLFLKIISCFLHLNVDTFLLYYGSVGKEFGHTKAETLRWNKWQEFSGACLKSYQAAFLKVYHLFSALLRWLLYRHWEIYRSLPHFGQRLGVGSSWWIIKFKKCQNKNYKSWYNLNICIWDISTLNTENRA